MKKNVGTIDRAARILVGLAALSLAFISGSKWGYLGFVPLITGLIGWCPPYHLLGISTCKKCTYNTSKGGEMRKAILLAAAYVTVATMATAGMQQGLTLPKNWENYKHIGSLIIPDKKSPLFGIHHFQMNKKGLDAFNKGEAYPEGTIIVGAVYEVVVTPEGAMNEGKKLFHTYMRKDSKAKDTGGWIFAAFAPDGKLIEKDVKADCFACHTAVKDSDYVFSKPLR
jgi:hypothetical protein